MADPTPTQFETRLRTIMEAYSLPGRRITYGAQQPLVLLKDNAGSALLIANNLVPVNGTTGFAKGCLLFKTDALLMAQGLYVNVGSLASCVFEKISVGQKVLSFAAVPAAGVACHAAVAGSAANAFPGPFINPTLARSLDCVFAAGWDGGNVTVTGVNQFNEAVSEVYVAVPGTTVAGTKIFSSITAAAKATVGAAADTVQLQTGGKIGIFMRLADTVGLLFVNDPADFAPPTDCPDGVVLDATYNAFTPESSPDGAITYKLFCNG